MIENTSEADILNLKPVWAKYWSPKKISILQFFLNLPRMSLTPMARM